MKPIFASMLLGAIGSIFYYHADQATGIFLMCCAANAMWGDK
jgi:hypothetical protein